MADHFAVSSQQLAQAQRALDISAFNGIINLANILRKRGLMTVEEAEAMHANMSKPLVLPDHANNPLVQDAQQNLDNLFSVLVERRD
jgi:hypothetical protein